VGTIKKDNSFHYMGGGGSWDNGDGSNRAVQRQKNAGTREKNPSRTSDQKTKLQRERKLGAIRKTDFARKLKKERGMFGNPPFSRGKKKRKRGSKGSQVDGNWAKMTG